jgi:protein disulfide-isomerase A6
MKPDWDKLSEAYAGSSSVVIGDVDCTADDGKSVCQERGVSGYPTIKYYTDETGRDGEKYSGGRTFDALDKFTKEKLAKKCDAKTKEDCDDQEKAYIDKMSAKGADAIAAEAKRLEGMKGGDMKPEKKAWLMKRIAVLQGLSGAAKEDL